MQAPRRWIVRYRKPGRRRWQRAPRFITPLTGFRTKADAQRKLAQLRKAGYAGHVATTDWLRILALAEGRKLVGVMEQGANNRGTMVDRIIAANYGVLGEPWCGDFVAWCYRNAGSKAVTRSWASVRLLGSVSGVARIPKRRGEPGDIVRFVFDHTGLLEGYCDADGRTVPAAMATHIRTIEGNTGATGAVSDSRTGGDGVYRKIRALSQVEDVLVVLR